ncbi:MAG: preprotein translocase subunit YajC [Acidimicrobiia bacterium]|nr:preprotein translocase subunit YajC [Acidimicrobiia bacterium]MDH5520606.1 preprotein translocase subunit YajC [Acidimicrobiia bacterium]
MDFVILIGFGLAMYLILFLPQQRRAKQHRELLASLVEGDEVVTSSGIYGFVNAVDGEILWLDVADGVELRMTRSSVASKIVDNAAGDEDE